MTAGREHGEPVGVVSSDGSLVLARRGFSIVAWAFVASLVVQLFLVGLDLFEVTGEEVGIHREWAYVYGWLAPLLVLLAVAARLPRRDQLLTLALLVLFAVQTYLPSLAEQLPTLAALHALNAIVVLWIAVTLALAGRASVEPNPHVGGS
jgi:hypothetical protein